MPLTLGAGGFTYKRVAEYLTDSDWGHPALLRPTQSEERSDRIMCLVARAVVRGQGKTEGYYDRTIPLRHRTVQVFGRGGGIQELGDISKDAHRPGWSGPAHPQPRYPGLRGTRRQ